jgi:glycosyltransferase involved in cell wall biosynthesis
LLYKNKNIFLKKTAFPAAFLYFSPMPEVSVILPFYNAEQTLEKAVKSILKQSFTDYELLLIDNNSSDNSSRIAQKLAEKDERINILHESRRGVVPALLKGFSECKADFIARMDSDDFSATDRLQLQYQFLKENPEYGLVSSRVRVFPATTSNMGLWRYVKWQNEIMQHEEMLIKSFVESPIVTPSIMYRKKVAEEHGYVRECDFPEDYEMFLRWLSKGVKFHKLDKVLLHWHDSESRLTRTDKRYRQEAFFKVKMDYLPDFLSQNNTHHPDVYAWGDGKYARKWKSMLKEKGINILASFEVDPAKVNNKEVLHYSEIPEKGKIFIVSLVSNKGAGDKIKEYLNFIDYKEGKDFILAG